MEANGIQQLFFQHLKSCLPPHLSMVDEVADLLEISMDSAYRRIRCEKAISLDEVQKIASHFKLSLDQVLQLKNDSFVFSGHLTNSESFKNWMQNMLNQLLYVNSFKEKKIYVLLKDIPLYDHFQIPELAAFKYFVWRKSILHDETLRGVKFSFDDTNPEFEDLGQKIARCSLPIPSVEVWNLETINTTLRQIDFYLQANVFKNSSDAQLIYDKILALINHKELQAETGKKFMINESPGENAATFVLLVNELILGDNTFHFVVDGKRFTLLNHSVINFITTTNETFNGYIHEMLQNLISKSTQISSSGEKERIRFFNRLREKVRISSHK